MEKRKQKEKIVKSLKREFSAGGIVFKEIDDKTFWLVTKSALSAKFPKDIWRLPKGWVDDEDNGENPGPKARGEKKIEEKDLIDSALREVREEGGVEAQVVKKIGTEKIFFTIDGNRMLKLVMFYLMRWVRDLPEGPGFETEKVEWLEYEGARKKLTYPAEKKFLDKAKQVLDGL